MIVLDSYAVIALLKGEFAAARVRDLFRDETIACLTALGVAEVIDHLVRLCGVDEDEAALDLAQLGLIDPLPLSPGTALRAGMLRARHYDRRTRAVSLADCTVAVEAQSNAASVASSDPHLLDLCLDEGIPVVPLPQSDGRMWKPIVP